MIKEYHLCSNPDRDKIVTTSVIKFDDEDYEDSSFGNKDFWQLDNGEDGYIDIIHCPWCGQKLKRWEKEEYMRVVKLINERVKKEDGNT